MELSLQLHVPQLVAVSEEARRPTLNRSKLAPRASACGWRESILPMVLIVSESRGGPLLERSQIRPKRFLIAALERDSALHIRGVHDAAAQEVWMSRDQRFKSMMGAIVGAIVGAMMGAIVGAMLGAIVGAVPDDCRKVWVRLAHTAVKCCYRLRSVAVREDASTG